MDGLTVGVAVGATVGILDGEAVGTPVGDTLGAVDGMIVGSEVGVAEGASVGDAEGLIVVHSHPDCWQHTPGHVFGSPMVGVKESHMLASQKLASKHASYAVG